MQACAIYYDGNEFQILQLETTPNEDPEQVKLKVAKQLGIDTNDVTAIVFGDNLYSKVF